MNTPEGRQVATEARRKWTSEQPPTGTPGLFVVRFSAGLNLCFGWEIRRFGSIVLSKSNEGYTTQAEAEAVGQKVLENMTISTPSQTLAE